MIKSQTVMALQSVTLHRVRVNRGESGSPNWKERFFVSEEEAMAFLATDLPENRHNEGVVPIPTLYDKSRDVYYIAKT